MEEALDHLSPEERAERLDLWAQERAERLRIENAQHLELRRRLKGVNFKGAKFTRSHGRKIASG